MRTVGAREPSTATPDAARAAPPATGLTSGILVLVIAALTVGAIVQRSTALVGALTVAAGVSQFVHGAWRREHLEPVNLASGVLYIVIGGVVVTHTAENRLAFALLAALFLTAQGIIRMVATGEGARSALTVVHAVVALTLAFITAAWALLHVIVSVTLDVLTWRVWQLPSVRGIGFFIAIDMLLCAACLLPSRSRPRP